MLKACSKCGEEKELNLTNFRKCNTVKSGYRAMCKSCESVYRKENKHKHDEWVKNNSDWIKNWKKENSEHIKKYQSEYIEKNYDKIRAKEKEYRKNNREKCLISDKIYAQKNKDKIKKWNREWYKNNKDKATIIRHRRRENERKSYKSLNNTEWEEIKKHFDYKCAYCGEYGKITLDHFIAVSKGGELSINNVIPCCNKCNCMKHAQNYFEWYPNQMFYSKERNDKILSFLNYKLTNNEYVQQLSMVI